jgi:hypothetical protein
MDATIAWTAQEFDNDYTFYTDSNGLGMVKRNYKEVDDSDALFGVHSNVPANFYPVNTALFIENTDRQYPPCMMLVMNDRP